MKKAVLCLGGIAILGGCFTGCENPADSALAGGVTGGAMGGLLKGTGRGVAQGAAIGAVGGYVLGKVSESERERGYYEGQFGAGGYEYAPPSYVPAPSPYPYPRQRRSIPYGHYSRTPGYVFSPYNPEQLIDVRSIPRGGQVIDPTTGRVFINP